MSQEEMEVPEHVKAKMTPAQRAALDSASSASMKVPRISVRGRMFRMVEAGEEVRKRTGPIKGIVLGVQPEAGNMIKTYYEAGYTPNTNNPPDCASDDGLVPSPWVSNKQNDSCKTCQWNKFGSATSPNKKPTKKCRDSKRIWFIDQTDWGVDENTKKVIKPEIPFEEEVIYGLNVSVASLQSFAECGRHLMSMGVPWSSAVVQISFADAEYPQMDFKVVGFVTPLQLPYVEKQAEAKPWAMFSTLALAAPDAGPAPSMALPGMQLDKSDVPAHVRAAAGAVQEEVKGDVDDAMNKF